MTAHRHLDESKRRVVISRPNGLYNAQYMERIYSSFSYLYDYRYRTVGQNTRDKERQNQRKDEMSASAIIRKSSIQGR